MDVDLIRLNQWPTRETDARANGLDIVDHVVDRVHAYLGQFD